jgi:hypothetical protein
MVAAKRVPSLKVIQLVSMVLTGLNDGERLDRFMRLVWPDLGCPGPRFQEVGGPVNRSLAGNATKFHRSDQDDKSEE